MTDSEIEGASLLFNRRNEQCKFLLKLCGGNKTKYIDLEVAIKKLHIHHCPGDEEEIDKILKHEKILCKVNI